MFKNHFKIGGLMLMSMLLLHQDAKSFKESKFRHMIAAKLAPARVRLHKFDFSCTVAQLHRSTVALWHSCTVAQLHCGTVALAVTQWPSDEMQFSRCRQVLSGHFGTFERLSRGGWPDLIQRIIVTYSSVNKKVNKISEIFNKIVTKNLHHEISF